jgi:hypothetical protein
MKHLFKFWIFVLCFWTILPLMHAQTDSITITKHCSKDSLYHFYFLEEEGNVPHTGKRDLKYTFSDMSEGIDTFCFKKIIEYLEVNKADLKKSFSIAILHHYYRESYDLLPDELKLQTITNNLRYGTSLIAWGHAEVSSNNEFSVGIYGKLLFDLGKKAIPYLQDILQDGQRVYSLNPSSESQTIYSWNQLRRKDFAYFCLAKILGSRIKFKQTPQKRDKIIQQFIEKYRKELSVK